MDTASLHFEHYEVPRRPDGTLCEMGRGAMGVTYRAYDTRLKVEVVLKVITPALLDETTTRERFLREARAAAKIRHPNAAAVIHLNDTDPVFYTMELVSGRSLSEVLHERGALPVTEALDYADQVAAALGALARERIVHRDLKPTNLLLTPDDERPFGMLVKVIDFGLAKSARGDGTAVLDASLSQSGVFTGTPTYASPEQCATDPDIDSRSDLYSLGIVLWEMISGKRPFVGALGQVIAMHQFKAPPWEQLEHVPEPVVAILQRLLAKDRAARFQTPRELRDAIAHAVENFGSTVVLDPPRASAPLAPAETVRLGTTLSTRYRVGADLGMGDGGRLFRASDNLSGDAPVAVKMLAVERLTEPGFLTQLERELGALRASPPAVVLLPLTGVIRSGEGAYFIREWAEGFSLLELLRARGEISASETWRLLEQLPVVLDIAAGENLTLAEPLLRKLFITPAPGNAPADWAALRAQPVNAWPDFRLRWNPVSFRSRADAGRGAADGSTTMPDVGRDEVNDDPVVALARLVRELLGGRPGSHTPLNTLRKEANNALGRALAPGGGRRAFGNAREFWTSLQQASAVEPARTAILPTVQVSAAAAEIVMSAVPTAPRKRRGRLSATFVVLALLAVGAAGAYVVVTRIVPERGRARTQEEAARRTAEERRVQEQKALENKKREAADEQRKREELAAAEAKKREAERERVAEQKRAEEKKKRDDDHAALGREQKAAEQKKREEAAATERVRLEQLEKERLAALERERNATQERERRFAELRRNEAQQRRKRIDAVAAGKAPQLLAVPGTFKTIQAALNASRPGDSIVVSPGTYAESLVIRTSFVSLTGADRERCIIRADAKTSSCLRVEGGVAARISGFTFEHSGTNDAPNRPSLIQITARDTELAQCTLRRGGGNGLTLVGGKKASAVIDECMVEDCAWSGIWLLEAGSLITVRGTSARSNGRYGILIQAGSAGTVEGCTVERNGWTGVASFDADTTTTIRATVCRQNQQHGIAFDKGGSGAAEGNISESNTFSGILVWGAGANPSIRGNRCTDNGKWGIDSGEGAKPTLANDNIVTGNKAGQVHQ